MNSTGKTFELFFHLSNFDLHHWDLLFRFNVVSTLISSLLTVLSLTLLRQKKLIFWNFWKWTLSSRYDNFFAGRYCKSTFIQKSSKDIENQFAPKVPQNRKLFKINGKKSKFCIILPFWLLKLCHLANISHHKLGFHRSYWITAQPST